MALPPSPLPNKLTPTPCKEAGARKSLPEDAGVFSTPMPVLATHTKEPSDGGETNIFVMFSAKGDKHSIFQLDICWEGQAQRDTAGQAGWHHEFPRCH